MTRHRPHHIGENAAGPRLWSSMEELSGDPAFQAWVDAEYPAAAEFTPEERRKVFGGNAASVYKIDFDKLGNVA